MRISLECYFPLPEFYVVYSDKRAFCLYFGNNLIFPTIPQRHKIKLNALCAFHSFTHFQHKYLKVNHFFQTNHKPLFVNKNTKTTGAFQRTV